MKHRVDACPIALWWDNDEKAWYSRSAHWVDSQPHARFSEPEHVRKSPETMEEHVLQFAGATSYIVYGPPTAIPVREAFDAWRSYQERAKRDRIDQRVTNVL